MYVELLINSGNQAVADENGRAEVARLLREAADKVDAGSEGAPLLDYNGNRVGQFTIDEEA